MIESAPVQWFKVDITCTVDKCQRSSNESYPPLSTAGNLQEALSLAVHPLIQIGYSKYSTSSNVCTPSSCNLPSS